MSTLKRKHPSPATLNPHHQAGNLARKAVAKSFRWNSWAIIDLQTLLWHRSHFCRVRVAFAANFLLHCSPILRPALAVSRVSPARKRTSHIQLYRALYFLFFIFFAYMCVCPRHDTQYFAGVMHNFVFHASVLSLSIYINRASFLAHLLPVQPL